MSTAVRKKWIRILLITFVVGLAFGLRCWAALTLPVDWDERIYGGVSTHYSGAIRTGNLEGITEFTGNQEHPRFYKLVYGAVLALQEPISPEWSMLVPTEEPPSVSDFPHLFTTRMVSVVFGTLLVLFIARINWLAGLFLAVHTYSIKYTSEVYLEALPFLLSALALFVYLRSERVKIRWLVLSGILLGLTASSKYVYALVGIAILVDWCRAHFTDTSEMRPAFGRAVARVFLWGGIALLAFVISDPYLWPNVVERIGASIQYHLNFQQGEYVSTINYPWWQPLVWLSQGVAEYPDVVFIQWPSIDVVFPGLALLGLVRMWRKWPVVVVWLVVQFAFLFIWGTKWPQYILSVAVPLALCAAEGVTQLGVWLKPLLDRRPSVEPVDG